MGYYSDDVYYNPEKFGLQLVGDIEWDDYSYEFDMTIVLVNDAGEYFMASDSGCSCPAPFEDFTSVESLEGPFDKQAVAFRLREGIGNHGRSEAELRKEVSKILRKMK